MLKNGELNEKPNGENKKNNSFRVFGFFLSSSHYQETYGLNLSDKDAVVNLNFFLLFPNTNMLYEIDSIAGLENFSSVRQSKMLIQTGFEYADLTESGSNLTDPAKPLSQKLSFFTSSQNLSLLSAMNVKYLLSSFELPNPLNKVFETKATKYNIPVYIYENTNVLPRIYFAKTPIYTRETNEDKLFEELLKIDNFKENTLIECSEPICQANTEIQTNDNDLITIEELKNGYLKLKTKTNNPRWLIYSESNLPTWEARLKPVNQPIRQPDYQPTKIYTANYIYQAVFVPKGEWEVEIKYGGVWEQMKYALENQFFKLFLKQ